MSIQPKNTQPNVLQMEKNVLQKAEALERVISTLKIELRDNQPLLNQLQMLTTNLQSSRDYLLSKDHHIAFIGSVGVGKTTAICGILGLMDEKGGTALSTSSGRTTLCEVEIRRGEKTRILISPCSPDETRSYLRDFVDILKMRHEGRAEDDGEPVAMSSEVERCVRNMIGLPVRTFKAPDGTTKRIDEALELFKKLGTSISFSEEAFKRLDLEHRVTTELVFGGSDEIAWIRDNFGEINLGKHPKTPMPKRIVIELARPLVNQPELNISLVDTKGLDGNVEREDIDRQFRNDRAICVVCSKFNDAPEQAVQALLKHLLESGLSQQVTQQTQLLILVRNDEAENMLSEEGPVASADEGRVVRQSQIQDTLRTRLKLSDQYFPQIHFFDARKNDVKGTEHALVQLILSLRKRRVDQIIEIAAAVEEISEHREKAQAKAAFETVSRAIRSWAQASHQRIAEIHNIHKPLVDDIATKEVYAATIRASVNRQGNWDNFDFYYKLALAARKKSVTSFSEAVNEIQLVLANFERQQDLKAAHPFIRQLLHVVNERMQQLYDAAAIMGRKAYEDPMENDHPFWVVQQNEWGKGPGYKNRIARGAENWFHHHSPASTDAQIQQRVMSEWNELVNTIESLLVKENVT
jgi:hypothetical protein